MVRNCTVCIFGKMGKGAWVECHKNAPSPHVAFDGNKLTGMQVVWPKMDYSDWCAEGEAHPGTVSQEPDYLKKP